MKKYLLALMLLASTAAMASVHLHNEDGQSYDITVKCSSGTVTQTSISISTVSDIGTGPCTVTIKDGGSTTAQDGQDIYIKNGGFSAGS